MDDDEIVELFLKKDESAIIHTAEKYGCRLRSISQRITADILTAEECENDTYLEAWNRIPPNEPRTYLIAFLSKIIRNISINKCIEKNRLKRRAYIVELSSEMEQCIPAVNDVESYVDGVEIGRVISTFLRKQPKEKRIIFMHRYYYCDTVLSIATFMLTIEQTDHILLPGDKITFSVNQLLSKKEHNNFKIEKIDTNNVYSITEFLEEPDIRGGSDSESESIDGDNMLFIKPDEANAIILKKGVAVTGYGIVEGKLHIQVRFSDILNTDNHGYVYLKNEDGKVVNCQSSVAFWDQSHVNSYEEFVFEVSAEELVNYEIWGEFWTCNNAPIEGEWQVTFPVEKNE